MIEGVLILCPESAFPCQGALIPHQGVCFPGHGVLIPYLGASFPRPGDASILHEKMPNHRD